MKIILAEGKAKPENFHIGNTSMFIIVGKINELNNKYKGKQVKLILEVQNDRSK